MLKFLGILLVSLLAVFVFNVTVFEQPNTLRRMADSLFVIGIFMFLFSLISVTQAGNVFSGVGYVVRNMFTNFQNKHASFYDYRRSKEKDSDSSSTTGFTVLIVSIILLTAAYFIGLRAMS